MGFRIAALVMFSLAAGVSQAQVDPVYQQFDPPKVQVDSLQAPADPYYASAHPVDSLQPGEFEWSVDPASVQGPLVIVVSLADQRAWVFRNGERIATSTVSTGKTGKETPTGVFPILEKKKVHHSNRYDNAPMPFMQRLTWDGVAMHAGRLPGYPASHGCVRLPKEFARTLFDVTNRNETVVISPDGSVDSLLAVGLPEWQARQVGHGPVPAEAFESGPSLTVMAD